MRTIDQVMVSGPHTAHPEMTTGQAMRLMEQCGIRHLPVLREGRLAGVVSQRDLIEMPFIDREDITVEDIMTCRPYICFQDQSIAAVTSHMARAKIGSALVVDDAMNLVGIFTTVDALHLLSQLLEEKEHEARRPMRTIGEYLLAG